MIRATLFATISMSPLLLGGPAAAQDASFGCKVLLCAAAATPSWSGIPYCVPVMRQLFTQLANGDGWPTCSQGDASPVGYPPRSVPCWLKSHRRESVQCFGARRRCGDDLRRERERSECGAPTPLQTGSSKGCNGAYVGGVAIASNCGG